MAFERELRSNETAKDTYWEEKLQAERVRLEQVRLNQEEELQKVIDKVREDQFPMTEPTVVMMTHDL